MKGKKLDEMVLAVINEHGGELRLTGHSAQGNVNACLGGALITGVVKYKDHYGNAARASAQQLGAYWALKVSAWPTAARPIISVWMCFKPTWCDAYPNPCPPDNIFTYTLAATS